MRKNLLTDIVEHIAVMKSPKNTTTPAVIANSSHVSTSIMPGSYIYSPYIAPPKAQHAMSAASKPRAIYLRTNGPLMNPHDAPTSFIVCMEKRRAYILRRTVLLMSENDTMVNSNAIDSNTTLILAMLALTWSTRSFSYFTSLTLG